MTRLFINGAPTLQLKDGVYGKLSVIDRTLKLTCKIDSYDERFHECRIGAAVSVEITGELLTAMYARESLESIGERPSSLYRFDMKIVCMWRDTTTFHGVWLTLEAKVSDATSGAPSLDQEIGL